MNMTDIIKACILHEKIYPIVAPIYINQRNKDTGKIDRCHGYSHYIEVMNASIIIGTYELNNKEISISAFISLLVAAEFHDTGRGQDTDSEDNHELYSVKCLMDNATTVKKAITDIFIIEDAYANSIINNAVICILEHRSCRAPSIKISELLKDADDISTISRYRCMYRVCSYYLDCINSNETVDMEDFVQNRKELIKRKQLDVANSYTGLIVPDSIDDDFIELMCRKVMNNEISYEITNPSVQDILIVSLIDKALRCSNIDSCILLLRNIVDKYRV